MKAQRIARAIAWAAISIAVAVAAAAQESAAQRGNAKFQHSCAPCHGAGAGDDGRAMLPGTDALRIKYKGLLPPLLEQRTDLTEPVLKAFLRNGIFSMPPFRPTEVSDADIADIAAYLAQSSKAAPVPQRK